MPGYNKRVELYPPMFLTYCQQIGAKGAEDPAQAPVFRVPFPTHNAAVKMRSMFYTWRRKITEKEGREFAIANSLDEVAVSLETVSGESDHKNGTVLMFRHRATSPDNLILLKAFQQAVAS